MLSSLPLKQAAVLVSDYGYALCLFLIHLNSQYFVMLEGFLICSISNVEL